MLQNW